MLARIENEPALALYAVQCAITLGLCFGAKLTPPQIGAIITFTGAMLSLLTRSMVTPVKP